MVGGLFGRRRCTLCDGHSGIPILQFTRDRVGDQHVPRHSVGGKPSAVTWKGMTNEEIF